jgi:anaphase-promoting complex subunit 10
MAILLNSCIYIGFGIDQLRDECTDTYWQSDGQLPHLVNIQFRKKTTIQDVWIYADYKADESYTPSRYLFSLLQFYFHLAHHSIWK